MTLRKSVTVVLVLVAVVTLGVLAGPRLMNRAAEAPAATPPVTAPEAAAPATEPSRSNASVFAACRIDTRRGGAPRRQSCRRR